MWFTPQTETVIVLALNKSLALLLSVLLAARVGAIIYYNTEGSDITTIERVCGIRPQVTFDVMCNSLCVL